MPDIKLGHKNYHACAYGGCLLIISEARNGRELPLAFGFYSLHWHHPSWHMQLEARVQLLLLILNRSTLPKSEPIFYLSSSRILVLFFWTVIGSLSSNLRYGCRGRHFLSFTNFSKKFQR